MILEQSQAQAAACCRSQRAARAGQCRCCRLLPRSTLHRECKQWVCWTPSIPLWFVLKNHHLNGCLAFPWGSDVAGGHWPRLGSRGGQASPADGQPTGDLAQAHTGSCCFPVEPSPEGWGEVKPQTLCKKQQCCTVPRVWCYLPFLVSPGSTAFLKLQVSYKKFWDDHELDWSQFSLPLLFFYYFWRAL